VMPADLRCTIDGNRVNATQHALRRFFVREARLIMPPPFASQLWIQSREKKRTKGRKEEKKKTRSIDKVRSATKFIKQDSGLTGRKLRRVTLIFALSSALLQRARYSMSICCFMIVDRSCG